MKILQVTPYFYPAWGYGGVTRVAYEISMRLANKGHEVIAYATDALDDKYRVKSSPNPTYISGVKTYYFKNLSNYLSYKYHLPLPLGMPFRIKEEVKNFDIIHLHGYRHVLNIVVHYYAKKYRIPYVLQSHGSLPKIDEKQKLKNLYDRVWGHKLLKDASKVIALTETEAEQYKKMGVDENKIEIVPNGINLDEYKKLPEKGIFRKKYSININDNDKIILYVGRLHKSKGIDLLVRTFSDISKESDDVKLVLVGPDDGYKAELMNLLQRLEISEKTIFTGFVSNEEKMAALINADVFVTPSFSGFPVTFLEAMFFGLPIITTDKGDKLDWIHNKVGFVAEYDKDQLRNAMLGILNDEVLKRKFGEEGKRLVKERFNWDNIVKKVEEIYKS